MCSNVPPDQEIVDSVARQFKQKYVRHPEAVRHFVVHVMIQNWHHVLHLERSEIKDAITGPGLNGLIYTMVKNRMRATSPRRCQA